MVEVPARSFPITRALSRSSLDKWESPKCQVSLALDKVCVQVCVWWRCGKGNESSQNSRNLSSRFLPLDGVFLARAEVLAVFIYFSL